MVIAKSFLCFTASPLYIGRFDLPVNLKDNLRPITLVHMDRKPILEVLLQASAISYDKVVSAILRQADLCEALLSTMRKLDMRQLIQILVNMRKAKNEVEDEEDCAIVNGLVQQTLSGTLPARDMMISQEINLDTWGKDVYKPTELEFQTKDFLEKYQDKLDIVVHESLISKTESFLRNLNCGRATALCGPSFSGKSTIINVSI